MDQTDDPLPAEFVIDVDGVDKLPDSFTWLTATTCELGYSEAVLGPTAVRLRYSTKSSRFKSVLGELVTPFDILVTPA